MQRRKSFSNQSVGGQSNRAAPRRRNSVVYVDTNRIRNEIQESIERTIEERVTRQVEDRVSRRVQEEVEERVSRRMQQEVEQEVSQRVNEQVQNTIYPFVQGFQTQIAPFFQAFNSMMPQYQVQMPECYIKDAYGNDVYIPSQGVTVYGFQANYLQPQMGDGNGTARS
jgi:hypothetical protein